MDPGVRSYGMKDDPPGYLWSKYECLMSGWWDILHSSCLNVKLWSNSTNGTEVRTNEQTDPREDKNYIPLGCRVYNEYMKLYEYQRWRSFIDPGPNHSDSIFSNFFSSINPDFNISSALRWAIQDQWSSGFLSFGQFGPHYWSIWTSWK